MSKTDKTDPFWVNVKLVEHHHHEDGVCNLPAMPTTRHEYKAQQRSWQHNRFACYWEPVWHQVKWERPSKKSWSRAETSLFDSRFAGGKARDARHWDRITSQADADVLDDMREAG